MKQEGLFGEIQNCHGCPAGDRENSERKCATQNNFRASMGTLTCAARELDAPLLEVFCCREDKGRLGWLFLTDRILLYKFPRNDYLRVLFIQEPSFCLPSQNSPDCHLCPYSTAILEAHLNLRFIISIILKILLSY